MKYFLLAVMIITASVLIVAEPPSTPIFLLNSSMHSNAVNDIDVDAAGNYIVTASSDKTMKLWSPKDGSLLQTYRLPIGWGGEGNLGACAISPDGSILACGGYTGWDWYKECIVFLVDRRSGDIIAAIKGFPNGINALDFSPDGAFLAVGLGGTEKKGLIIVNVKKKSIVKTFFTYANNVTSVQFLPNGKLIASSYDGSIVLYSPTFIELKKVQTLPDYPGKLSISPDGKKVAVVMVNAYKVSVYDAATLQKLYDADTTGINALLWTVAWSADDHLYASGLSAVKKNNAWFRTMRVWSNGGKGAFIDIPITDDSTNVFDIVPIGKGSVVFGGLGADLGSMSATRVLWYHTTNRADFSGLDWKPGILRINETGTIISFTDKKRGDFSFSIKERRLQNGRLSLSIYKTQSSGSSVTQWFHRSVEELQKSPPPMLNGRTVNSWPAGFWCRSLDVADDGSSVVFGGDNDLMRINNNNTQVWSVRTNSIAWDTNITADGRIVVGAFADGTIRWYRMTDGLLLASMYIDIPSRQWIIWTPEGYYDCSASGDSLVGWHMNNGIDKKADFYDAAKFFDRFYHPDVVAACLKEAKRDTEIAVALGIKSSTKSFDDGIKHPPKVAIVSPVTATSRTEQLVVEVEALDQGGGVGEIRLYLNGKQVADDTRSIIVAKEKQENSVRKKFTILLSAGENRLSATALADDKSESNPAVMTVTYAGPQKTSKLYAVVIGINQYKNSAYNLNFAKADAEAYAAVLRKNAPSIFESVTIEEIYDTSATKQDIVTAINEIAAKINPEDVFVLYYAGHGVMSDPLPGEQPQFFLIPTDVVKMYLDTESLSVKGISAAEVKEWCKNVKAQKQLVIFDACQSGGALNQFASRGAAEEKAIMQLARSTGIVVLASTGTEQFATEFAQLGHGVFTFALLEGLQGNADGGTKDGKITVKELEAYINDRVPELTKQYKGDAQYPTSYSSGQDFPLMTVDK